jgi:CheY-like chemotaxis protein
MAEVRQTIGPNRSKILVVEDDSDIREDLAELLRDQGYRVTTAANGIEALEHLRAELLPCLILLDLMMPVMDGWELRRQLMADERLASVPIVLLTGASDPEDHARTLSVADVMTKPIRLERLYATIERYCTR